jgi:hypothetical protein
MRNAGKQTCTAFPDRIPDDIWWNRVDHREPVDGDQGIQWEPRHEGVQFPDWAMQVGDVSRATGHTVGPG